MVASRSRLQSIEESFTPDELAEHEDMHVEKEESVVASGMLNNNTNIASNDDGSFSGGPSDMSVLKSYKHHVAAAIWNNEVLAVTREREKENFSTV
ncbi:hypothetical protein Scep_001531 [Stephania cephalantha]|uniref:Uncharacterized protein n=1 Tax=Stephania cephalantha TaxID=152367 RepID=A0AAP0L986_9MAGN